MNNDIEKVLYSEEDIQATIARLAKQVAADYQDKDPLIVSVLSGAVLFTVDLIKKMDIMAQLDFIDALPEYDLSLYVSEKMKTNEDTSLEMLRKVLPVLEGLEDFSEQGVHDAMFGLIAELGVKNGYLLWPLRIALSGKQFTPGGGVEIAAILGKEESLARIRRGIEKLENR